MNRPKLTAKQKIEFLELIARMSGDSVFERKFNLSANDVNWYKKDLDVETPDEARRLAKKLSVKLQNERNTYAVEQTKKAREAARVANERLRALEAGKAKALDGKESKVDKNKIKREDAERQKRFAESQTLVKPELEWRLPIEVNGGSEQEQIDRFRREIIYHGIRFLQSKYTGVTKAQIMWEAHRLNLNINWDLVR